MGIKKGRMGARVFNNSNLEGIKNYQGAVCLGNWLIKYLPDDSTASVKIADLGNDGVKIEHIADNAINKNNALTSVDLEMIQTIGDYNFYKCEKLEKVIGCDSVGSIGQYVLEKTPWYENEKANGFVRIGNTLKYYRTDSDTIDLTTPKMQGIKFAEKGAMTDCKNAVTLKCNSDCVFDQNCFYKTYDPQYKSLFEDQLPLKPIYKFKNVYVDGKLLTYDLLIKDTKIHSWLQTNFFYLKGSEFLNNMTAEKTKELFKQLDIPYCGMGTGKTTDYTPTEEFYIRLKIHNYVSQFDYDHHFEYNNFVDCFLLGGKATCTEYALFVHYLLECAGIEAKTFYVDPDLPDNGGVHFWNGTKIGDEWFMNDDGWDAQSNSHSYSWFLRSYSGFCTSDYHTFMESYDSFHLYPETKSEENVDAPRYVGDTNGNDKREKDDAVLLWSYLKGEADTISEKNADVNFDGKIDITDAVLLDQFVNSKTLDLDKIPDDSLAPAVKIAFVNGTDYDNIQYVWTDRGGYIKLPELDFEAPEGKKLSYDIGKVGQEVRITNPLTVVQVKWVDENEEDSSSKPDSSSEPDKKNGISGDVNNDGSIDIEDAVAIIQHINGMTPLTADEETRADVSKDKNIDIDDAVTIISYINGNSTF